MELLGVRADSYNLHFGNMSIVIVDAKLQLDQVFKREKNTICFETITKTLLQIIIKRTKRVLFIKQKKTTLKNLR